MGGPRDPTSYLPNLRKHLTRLIEAWPWPLLALSLVGLALKPGPVAAPLLQILVIPALVVVPEPRFALIYLPSLAVFAAAGAGALAARMPRRHGAAMAGAAALVLTVWCGCGRGPPRGARRVRRRPMAEMRAAGEWLRANGRPIRSSSTARPRAVLRRHASRPAPDDDYDVVRYAESSGARTGAGYVVESLRPQLLPLITDAGFHAASAPLRAVFHMRGPHSGWW
jgi:hypothetical protein